MLFKQLTAFFAHKYLLVIMVVFTSIGSAVAQTQFLFRNYTAEKHLSSNVIRCILQDSKGYMWFGTKRGLNRFDGTHVKLYQNDKNNPKSLGSDFVHSLVEASDSTIWVGTDKGLYILNVKTDQFSYFEPLKKMLIYSMLKDKQGNIWIASHGNGVYCVNPKTKNIKRYDTKAVGLPAIVPAKALAQDNKGNIWIGTETRGVMVLDVKTGKSSYYNTTNSSLQSNDILSIYKDMQGNIWVGTMNGGLAKFNVTTNLFKTYQKGQQGLNNNIVRSIYQPSQGKLFVGTEGGLNLLDITTDKFTTYTHQHNNETSISDNAIYAINGDRERGIWIGTYFGGVNYLRQPNEGIERYVPTGSSQHVSGRAVSCFLEDVNGNMWIGTEDAGLNYFNAHTKIFKHYPFNNNQQPLPYYNLHVLTRDSQGQIWIGTFSGGLSVYNPANGQVKTYKNKLGDKSSISSNTIYSIYEDKEKRMWIGTLDGINLYQPHTDSFMRVDSMNRSSIYSIHESSDEMWFATNNYGLLCRNKQTGKWQQFTVGSNKGALSSEKLLAMQADAKGNLWLGTEGGGLNLFSTNKKTAKIIGEADGLPIKVVYSLVLDQKGYLWIASEKGLYSLNTNNGNIRFHSVWDGTKSLIFNYQASYLASDGRIYLGGTNGFGVFHPDSLRNINTVPKVVLSNFQIFNEDVVPAAERRERNPLKKAITYTDKIVLSHYQTVINIEYAGLSYISPEKINYAYKLDGLDDHWNHVGNQQKAGYSNLPPGEYTFRVKVDEGYENNRAAETTLQIIVLPPFYKTTTAYVFYILIAVAMGWWLRNYYRKKHQHENEIKLERLRIKNEKEFYSQKIDFFTMMAHEVRTPLSLIAAPVEKLLEAENWSENDRKQLETIDKNTERLCSLVNQLLDFRRIESDFYEMHLAQIDLVAHIKSIYDNFASTAMHHKLLKFTWHTSFNRLTVNTDAEAINKILSNLIVNALKFARTQVAVELVPAENEKLGKCYSLNVQDDGIGIPADQLENIFKKFFKVTSGEHQYNNLGGSGIGLALAKLLTEKLGGEMQVESIEGKSTIFKVLLPFTEEQANEEKDDAINDDTEIIESADDNILIAEDDPELQHFIKESIAAEGYHVLTAKNGKEALALMDVHKVSLVISDVMMPEMDGIELCKQVKEDILRCHIPVILLTAKTNSDTELAGLENGADAYITKPFKVKHLIARVKSLLDNRKKLMQKYASYPFITENQPVKKSRDQQFIEKIVHFIEEHISDPNLSVESLSAEMAMSKSVFQRKMKALTDNSPNEFMRLIRLQYAAQLLLSNEYRISEIGYMSGFSSHSYFSRCFYDHFKLTPSEYIEQHTGQVD